MAVVPLFSKHMWRHTLCLNNINTAKIMHLGQSSACNQDYENAGFLIFLNKWSMYRWLEMYSDMVLVVFLFFNSPVLSSLQIWLASSSISCSGSKGKCQTVVADFWAVLKFFQKQNSMPRRSNCNFSALFNDSSFGFWLWLMTTCNYKEDLDKPKSK